MDYCSNLMERLQGPINYCFFGEHLETTCLEQEFVDTESFRLQEEEFFIPSLEDKMPFLQMLQSVESPQFFPFKETNFQTRLRLQNLKQPWEDQNEKSFIPIMENQIQALELESCVTTGLLEAKSPLKPESNEFQNPPQYSASLGSVGNLEQPIKSQPVGHERRKRKRTRASKNKEDVENQRMTHIAVERNRRRQMNDHLSVLRSFMPPAYILRGDQASIVGGAINFVKELEQLVQSLEAQKWMRKNEGFGSSKLFGSSSPINGEMRTSTDQEASYGDEMKAETKSETADIEVTVIQTHVNLKIQCQRRQGQLIKAIVAFEDLGLSVLHLNITSSQASVLYSFNLKMEDDCKVNSANKIAEAVHHIFNFINGI